MCSSLLVVPVSRSIKRLQEFIIAMGVKEFLLLLELLLLLGRELGQLAPQQ